MGCGIDPLSLGLSLSGAQSVCEISSPLVVCLPALPSCCSGLFSPPPWFSSITFSQADPLPTVSDFAIGSLYLTIRQGSFSRTAVEEIRWVGQPNTNDSAADVTPCNRTSCLMCEHCLLVPLMFCMSACWLAHMVGTNASHDSWAENTSHAVLLPPPKLLLLLAFDHAWGVSRFLFSLVRSCYEIPSMCTQVICFLSQNGHLLLVHRFGYLSVNYGS